jgi:hypothetical protein
MPIDLFDSQIADKCNMNIHNRDQSSGDTTTPSAIPQILEHMHKLYIGIV